MKGESRVQSTCEFIFTQVVYYSDDGYDIENFRLVDPVLGTMEQLEELFTKAHDRGIKVILDFVSLNKCFEILKLFELFSEDPKPNIK